MNGMTVPETFYLTIPSHAIVPPPPPSPLHSSQTGLGCSATMEKNSRHTSGQNCSVMVVVEGE